MSDNTIRRYTADQVREALEDTRVVLVTGPRQSGKTTLVEQFVTKDRTYVTLDDSAVLEAARADPTGFIRTLGSAVIDEIQRAPELMLAIKVAVDIDKRPGRFLLTGSANVMALPTVGDSLAGRIALVELMPLAQAELHGVQGKLIDRLFSDEKLTFGMESADSVALRAAIVAGGFPEALQRSNARRRLAWFDDYIRLLIDRDARETSTIEQLEQLPNLVAHLAEQAGQSVNISSLSNALQLSRPTVARYVEALERIYLVRTLPPWHSNRIARLIKTPKIQFFDSGLLASLRRVTELSPIHPTPAMGPLFETFVHGELRKLMGWSETKARLYHFRTRQQDEVDFVLEDSIGRIVGIEVKSGATLRRKDFSGLEKLQEAAGDRFVRGFILHDHDRITPHSERIQGAPLSLLWSM